MATSIEEHLTKQDALIGALQIGMRRINDEIADLNERQRQLLESLRQMRTGQGVLRRSISIAWAAIVRRNSTSTSKVAS